jgi:predicted ArsR family transcriptional regulator
MERLPVFKALGDNTRYAIYLEVARSETPVSTSEIADALDLHPNTVRPHLERMRDVGLLVVETGAQGQVGRPQHRWALAPEAPSLGLEPSAFRLLARLMAGAAARAAIPEDEIVQIGWEHGASMVGEARGGSFSSCVAAVEAHMAALGFDPALAEDGDVVTVAFTRCPFRELAEAFPEVVCPLHRGLVEGVAEAAQGGRVRRFGTLADRDPCQADLVAG